YEEQGAFASVVEDPRVLMPEEIELVSLKKQRRYREFIELAATSKQNMIISGATGSGKTTFARAVIDKVPAYERLISIENVDELKLRNTHEDSVAMFYSGDGQGLSEATPQTLMQSSLRQKPDRVFLAELITGNEAFYFMDTVSSGHRGSISTMHAENPRLCIERLISLIRRSDDGRTMTTEDIRKMVHMCIDIFIQFKVVNNRRVVTEIYYEPEYKKSLMD
ncbi:MAG: ATPase, T2SS/T4P/T4SS family, partial [Janthinobacterium sp.]